MNKQEVKDASKQIAEIRKKTIITLKAIAKQHGEDGYIEFASLPGEPTFVQSNTEDVIYGYNSKGVLEAENEEDKNLNYLSTDLLILILEVLIKKLKIG